MTPALLARLTDSAPPLVLVEGPVICAWCADFDPKAASNRHASHGICPACSARMDAEY